MLSNLVIENIALIKKADIEFKDGFNVLLGETGAGKSIIFDALNFVLGGKADKTLLRSGEEYMKVNAVFANLDETVISFLREQEIEDDEVVISRSYTIDGKNSIKLNGENVALSVLKKIGALLVDTYSQHDSMELLNNKKHLSLLDKFGGEDIIHAKTSYLKVYEEFKSLQKSILDLGGDDSERERLKEIYLFQIKEIENANLVIGEEEEIRDRIKFLSSSEKIFENLNEATGLLSENNFSVLSNLSQIKGLLSSISEFDEINECKEKVSSVFYELEDVYETIESIKDRTDFDENELNKLDSRLDVIKSLNKKYGGSIENVLKFYSDIKEKYNNLMNSDEVLNELNIKLNDAKKRLVTKANELTKLRKQYGDKLKVLLMNELQDLSMKGTLFDVEFDPGENLTSEGQDNVKFIFSANKGQELKDISKVASGGELSRLMLAFKNIFNENNKTVVFDEIDAGISGEVGNKVAEKLSNLSKTSQVLCITHMPQVASAGDSYLYVGKYEESGQTYTKVRMLDENQEVENIARLIGGDNLTQVAIEHAKEMKERYRQIKNR